MNTPQAAATLAGMTTATPGPSQVRSPRPSGRVGAATAIPPAALKRTLKAARLVLMGSAALLLLLGVVIWTGSGDRLITVHIALGAVLVLTVWVLAVIATTAGVSRLVVAVAVVWSLIVPVLGLTQDGLVAGGWHWTVQVLHLVVSMGLVGWGQALLLLTGKRVAGSRIAQTGG